MRISDWSSDVCSSDLPVLVKERRRLEAPVHLEGIGAGADLAAAEIEDAPSRLAGAPHHSPVHEVVGGVNPGRPAPAAIVGQHLEIGRASRRAHVCPYV